MKGSFMAIIIIASCICSSILISCAGKPRTVDATTGEVIQKGNILNGERYYIPKAPISTRLGISEYTRGGMTYLIMETSQGIAVVNYTLDSAEMTCYYDGPLPPVDEPPKISNTNLTRIWKQ